MTTDIVIRYGYEGGNTISLTFFVEFMLPVKKCIKIH